MSSPNNYTLIFSPEAVMDMKDIVASGVANWGEARARKYLQKLKNALEIIQQSPYIGHIHPQLSSSYRVYHVERHYIIYTIKDVTIEVVRVLHDRMDLPRHIR